MDLITPRWQKSSYSGTDNNCIEVAAIWQKSSYSGTDNCCVEVATVRRKFSHNGTDNTCVQVGVADPLQGATSQYLDSDPLVAVRDSKDPDGPRLYFTPADWATFRAAIHNGEFDNLSPDPRLS